MSGARRWTTSADVAARVRRRWDDGSLLRSLGGASAFEPIEVPLRGPRASEIGDDLAAVRSWVAELDRGRRSDRRYGLVWKSVGGRNIGRNSLPARAIVSSLDQVRELLGVGREVDRFEEMLALAAPWPAVRAWILTSPHRALAHADRFDALLAAYEWLDLHRGSGTYLREVSAPGVDTKFIETNRSALAGMLGVSSTPAGFLSMLGLATKPQLVRVRPAASLGLVASGVTEVALRPDELRRLELRPASALVIENEITYLSVDVPADGVVLWGRGFDVDQVGRLAWLADADVVYWGDIDTHGFAILDRLRAFLPHTRSVLMDRETLLAHRERWVTESSPAASTLTRLTVEEFGLYDDLVSDVFGERVRLEQERVDWWWAAKRLSAAAE